VRFAGSGTIGFAALSLGICELTERDNEHFKNIKDDMRFFL